MARGTGRGRRHLSGVLGPVPDLGRTIEEYLTYLRVERGLADATLRAYRSDLGDFRSSIGDDDRWARTPDVAIGYLASRSRRGRPDERSLAPTSLRRRAAALKGFYRFAYGEGLIPVDVAAHLELPRQVRRLPDTLDVDEVDRLLEAASAGGPRDRALLELLYAAGLRVSEALRLDREDLSLDGAFVRVIGKGDKERLVPVGDTSPWTGSSSGSTGRAPSSSPRTTSRRSAADRCSSEGVAGGWPASRPGGSSATPPRAPA